MMLTNLVIAPATPPNTARVGGVLYPILRSLALAFGSEPNNGPRKIGAYLIYTTYVCDAVISATFMTALGANIAAYGLAVKTIPGLQWIWMDWFVAASVPCFTILLFCPGLHTKCTRRKLSARLKSRVLPMRNWKKWAS